MGEDTYKLQVVLDLRTIAKIDAVAENNGLDRTNAFRLMVNYALRTMPYEVTGLRGDEKHYYKNMAFEDRIYAAEEIISKYERENNCKVSDTLLKEIYDIFGVQQERKNL